MAPELDSARQSSSGSCAAGWAAPSYYTDQFGHPRLRARHMPFSIGIKERDQWVACMESGHGRDRRAR